MKRCSLFLLAALRLPVSFVLLLGLLAAVLRILQGLMRLAVQIDHPRISDASWTSMRTGAGPPGNAPATWPLSSASKRSPA